MIEILTALTTICSIVSASLPDKVETKSVVINRLWEVSMNIVNLVAINVNFAKNCKKKNKGFVKK